MHARMYAPLHAHLARSPCNWKIGYSYVYISPHVHPPAPSLLHCMHIYSWPRAFPERPIQLYSYIVYTLLWHAASRSPRYWKIIHDAMRMHVYILIQNFIVIKLDTVETISQSCDVVWLSSVVESCLVSALVEGGVGCSLSVASDDGVFPVLQLVYFSSSAVSIITF